MYILEQQAKGINFTNQGDKTGGDVSSCFSDMLRIAAYKPGNEEESANLVQGCRLKRDA